MRSKVVGGDGGDNWSYKTRKAPVKSSPPTNQHATFYRLEALLSPNQQCPSTKGKTVSFTASVKVISVFVVIINSVPLL